MTLPIYPRSRLSHVLLVDPEEHIRATRHGELVEPPTDLGHWRLFPGQMDCPDRTPECRHCWTYVWSFVPQAGEDNHAR